MSKPAAPKNSAQSSLHNYAVQRLAQYQAKKAVNYSDLPLLEFIPKVSPNFTSPDHLAAVIPYMEAVFESPQKFTLSAPPRHAKALADSTPMSTSRGWLRADAVVVGDYLYGSNGKFTKVLGVYPQGEVELFKVSLSDHSSLTVCAEHRWSVKWDKWCIKTTSELLLEFTKKWQIPIVPIEVTLPDRSLPVAPTRFIESIQQIHRGFARCFEVDAADHLFCAGKDYVVSHNSETVFHFMAKFIAKYPHLNVAYCSYSAKFAERKSVRIRDLVTRCGVALDKSTSARGTWRTEAGGYFLARGPGGDLTGEGVNLLVCDDPYASRGEAESAAKRENFYDWWTSVAMTRLEPKASVIVSHTRWALEDLTGVLTEEKGWPNISIPAIDLDGNALWPSRYTLEDFAEKRKDIGEFDWASMYMCSPRPRGGALFGSTTTYSDDDLARVTIKKYVVGIDLAYTAKTYSDFSVAVVVGIDEDKNVYVVDVRKKQCQAKDFASVLRELRFKYNNPQIIWYTGGQEKAIAEFFRNSCGVPVKDIPARDDKFVRAQAAAAAWNSGRILIPGDHKPWLDAFLSEVLGFTGVSDSHDDQVDALAAAFHPLASKQTKRGNMSQRLLSY